MSTSTLTPNPTTPPYSDDVEWITAYLTIHMLSAPSRRYAYLLWIAVVLVFLVFAVLHWTGSRGGYLGAYWTKWSLPRRTWRKKHKLDAAQRRGEPRTPPMPLPSNAQILCLTVLVLGSLALCFAGPDYIAPISKVWQFDRNSTTSPIFSRAQSYDTSTFTQYQPQYTIPKAWWTSGGRTGLIAFALFPLAVLFALKAPPFAIFAIPFSLQIHFDKLAWLHRWTGRLIWFITALHVALWSVQLALDYRAATDKMAYIYAWEYEKFIFGWIAFGLLTLVVVFSIQPLRRSHYEAFYFLHIILVPMTLVMSALHHPPVWYWCWAALALWGGERLWRATWWLSTNGFFGTTKSIPVPEEKTSFLQGQRNYEIRNNHSSGLRSPPHSSASPSQQTLVESAQFRLPAPVPSAHVPSAISSPGPLDEIRREYPPSERTVYPPRNFADSPNGSSGDFSPPSAYAYVPPFGYAHVELLAGMTVRLRFITPGYLSWAPGQHFLVTVPAVSLFCSHPFTCASICDEQAPTDEGREIVLLIRAKNGWTRDLWDEVSSLVAKGRNHHPSEKMPESGRVPMPSRGVLLRILVDGPFGSAVRARWNEHSTALIVTGGSGVSFGLAVLEYLCLCLAGRDGKYLGGRPGGWGKTGFRMRRIRFVWLVREFSHIQWCASIVRRCMAMIPSPGLQVDIFVTNIKTPPNAGPPPPFMTSQPHNTSGGYLAPPTPQFARQGRSRSGSTSSTSSMESEEDPASEYVDLSYYTGEYNDEDQVYSGGDLGDINVVDLTNFDGDDDTVLPGEAQFSHRVKKEGRHRRRQSKRVSRAKLAKLQLEDRGVVSGRRRDRTSVLSTDRLMSPVSLASPTSHEGFELNDIDLGTTSTVPSSSAHERVRSPIPANLLSPKLYSPSPVPGRSTPQHPIYRGPDEVRMPTSDWNTRPIGISALIMPPVARGAHGEQVQLELDPQEMRDIGIVAEHARPGRPKLDRILADEVEASRGSTVVACCGPSSLNAVMRKIIVSQINPGRVRRGDMRGSITLVSEEFEY